MKRNFLILLVLTMVCFSVSCQSQTVSGRYVADDEDSVIQYLEFTSSSTVRIGMEFMGLEQRMTATYKIVSGSVIITSSEGTLELEIENNKTLIGVGLLIDGIEFIKE